MRSEKQAPGRPRTRHFTRTLALGAAVVLGLATPARAQLCAGAPSFNRAPIQLGLAPGVAAGELRLALYGAAGTDFVFGSAGVALEPAEGTHGGRRWTVRVGANQPIRLDNRLHVCPLAGLSWDEGRTGADPSGLRVSGGLALGALATNGHRLAIVPHVAVSLHRDRIRSRGSRTFGTLTTGLAAVLTNGVAAGPTLTLPFGNSDEAIAIAATVTLPLGGR